MTILTHYPEATCNYKIKIKKSNQSVHLVSYSGSCFQSQHSGGGRSEFKVTLYNISRPRPAWNTWTNKQTNLKNHIHLYSSKIHTHKILLELTMWLLLATGIFKRSKHWTGEMAQRLRALTAFPEILSSIPSNRWWLTTICNGIWCPLLGEPGVSTTSNWQ
jgi:Fe-S cluster biosynthesis and repair protein YggX